MVRQKPMYQYSSVNDLDHHSFVPLVLTEIEAWVKGVTTLSSGSFMDKDLSIPLSKDVVSSLVSSFFESPFTPLSFFVGYIWHGLYRGLGPWHPVFRPP